MQFHAMAPRDGRDRLELGGRVDGTELRRLGQADRRRLRVMHKPLLEMSQCALDRVRRQLGVGAFDGYELGAMGEEFRRAAFVDRDMRFGVG